MIFEAVPNISLADKPEMIAPFQQAIELSSTEKDPVKLLDTHYDKDHNRAVFTYIGTKTAIINASLALLSTAYSNLSLKKHRGIHPFRGIVDVLPIIPLKPEDMPAAIEISCIVGDRAKAIFGVPVFFYENSSRGNTPARLPDLRKYLLENSDALEIDPDKGVLITGARGFLVAYNVNIKSTDLQLAKNIARDLREANSGLEGLRAIGLFLNDRGQVQVSCNLTKPDKVTTKIIYNEVKSLLKTYKKSELQLASTGRRAGWSASGSSYTKSKGIGAQIWLKLLMVCVIYCRMRPVKGSL